MTKQRDKYRKYKALNTIEVICYISMEFHRDTEEGGNK